MYPPPPHKPSVSSGLTRYVSAPGAFLTRAVDSVIGSSEGEFSAALASPSFVQYFSGDSSSLTSESTCKMNSSDGAKAAGSGGVNGLQRSYGFNEINGGSLARQKSSPAGFLNHLSTETNGFTITRGNGGYNAHNGSTGNHHHHHPPSRLKSELSFTRQDSLSQVSEVSESAAAAVEAIGCSDDGRQNSTPSYPTTSFRMEPWESSNNIVFSCSPTKKRKPLDGDIFHSFNALESQFSMPQTTLEMAAVEKLLNIPEDSVPCKIRAKRGCATHPRSIAERERRTRISGKLKKLQDLVPNMDKQTSYADMLDLAVQHIKGLQTDVKNLHKELENCTCGCKPTSS